MPPLLKAKLFLRVQKQSYLHRILQALPRQITLQGMGKKERQVGVIRTY